MFFLLFAFQHAHEQRTDLHIRLAVCARKRRNARLHQRHLLHHVQLAAHEQSRAVLLETLRGIALCVNNFHVANMVILYGIQLKLLGLRKILTDFSVVICCCNLHLIFSFSR